MPRSGRLHIDGGYYHVMGHGLERRRIFSTTPDKRDFLSRLGGLIEKMDYECMAWAIMPNHYHLLIRVDQTPLSRFMAKLLSGYATTYNLRHKRKGYVFQNRFKSILCDADSYFLELVRYIHLNPLRAKIINSLAELDNYAWTGHTHIIGKQTTEWQNIDTVLNRFSKNRKTAIQLYIKYMHEYRKMNEVDLSGGGLIRSYGGWEEIAKLSKNHEMRIGDERILGDSSFVEEMLNEDSIKLKVDYPNSEWNLKKLITYVCNLFDIPEQNINIRGRNNTNSRARELVCYWGSEILGIKSSELEKTLSITQSSVSRCVSRGRIYCLQNKLTFPDPVQKADKIIKSSVSPSYE